MEKIIMAEHLELHRDDVVTYIEELPADKLADLMRIVILVSEEDIVAKLNRIKFAREIAEDLKKFDVNEIEVPLPEEGASKMMVAQDAQYPVGSSEEEIAEHNKVINRDRYKTEYIKELDKLVELGHLDSLINQEEQENPKNP